jgi:hypothetical protein
VRFWDSSALVPLLVTEAATTSLNSIAANEAGRQVWWATETECASALTRKLREGSLGVSDMALGFRRLRRLADDWLEIEPSDHLREIANRFLRVHPLRTADALQLAAAFVAADGRPSSLEIITLDDRLADAARKEGFTLVDIRPG